MLSTKLSSVREWLIPLHVRVPLQKRCARNHSRATTKCGSNEEHNNGSTSNADNNSNKRVKSSRNSVPKIAFITSISLFGWWKSKEDEEETPEEKLITTIKRSILSIQREQYDKAEQLLHLALRMAQDLQSKDGITYVYDVMANLAMERGQFKKAEKLFADVMQRLFSTGHTEESPKMLHISAKLAHIAQLQGDLEKASLGFTWTLKKLQDTLHKMPDDKDMEELVGYGQLLMKKALFAEAKKLFEEAYAILVAAHGINEEAVTILNNLSVACLHMDNVTEAKNILLKAIELAKQLKDTAQESILLANLGLIYLREGLISEAQESCRIAWRMGKNAKNTEAVEQANYCLNEIKSL